MSSVKRKRAIKPAAVPIDSPSVSAWPPQAFFRISGGVPFGAAFSSDAVAAVPEPTSKYLALLQAAKVESQGPRPLKPGPTATKEELQAYQENMDVSCSKPEGSFRVPHDNYMAPSLSFYSHTGSKCNLIKPANSCNVQQKKIQRELVY